MKRIEHLDTIQRHGKQLDRAIDMLSREELKAMANRYDMTMHQTTEQLRFAVKRAVIGVTRRD